MSSVEERTKERERKAAWRLANPEKQRAAESRARARQGLNPTPPSPRRPRHEGWRYGLKPGEYARRLDSQKGVCAVCGRVETWRLPRKLSVDHDHLTGIVRGLLCHRCNIGIGYFEDDPERLHSAAKYLLRKRTPRRAKKFDPLVHFDPGL